MDKRCCNCSRQFLCKDFKKLDNCNKFLSWIYTKNYGEVHRVEDTKTNNNKQ